LAKVLVTGGAGYVGCSLVPKLLAEGHEVTVYDLMLFGSEGLPSDPKLRVVEGDIRNTAVLAVNLVGIDSVIHLAAIANDPSWELDPELSRTINYDCFEPLVAACRDAGVRRFINASTSSVYGVSDAAEVTEEHPLVPVSDYNKYKGLCEPILLNYHTDNFTTVIIRPATVCGYSPRTRLDLTVNILTNHAVNRGKITVFGGSQKRPNIHIDDIAELYVQLLTLPTDKVGAEIFNAAYQNNTVLELAEIVRTVVENEIPEKKPITIEVTASDDPRSYHVTSRKITEQLGWKPKRTIEDAVRGLCAAFQAGKLPDSMDDPRYFNVKTIKRLALV